MTAPTGGETKGRIADYGGCLVISDDETGFFEAFSALARPILAEAGEGALQPVRHMRLSELPALSVHAPTASRDLLERMARQALLVIDVSGGKPAAMYLLALAHALRNALTIAAYLGEPPQPPLLGLDQERLLIDLGAAEAPALVQERVREALRHELSFYDSPLRAARLLSASLASPLAAPHPEWGPVELYRAGAPGPKRAIALALGDIKAQTAFNVWVNSENIDMEMARVSDRSISAVIRHLGSGGDDTAWRDTPDHIRRDLAHAMGSRREVAIGDVIITKVRADTKLQDNNKVDAVAHVAAVKPRGPGGGFVSSGAASLCVRNVLAELHIYGKRSLGRRNKVLFPLLGTGDGGAPVEVVAPTMISAIDAYAQKHPGHFELIGVCARTVRDHDACRAALTACGYSGPLRETGGAEAEPA